MESYSVHEIFTPTTPAVLAFVERQQVNDRLVDALRIPGKQIVVYGHSGSGKTTLLINKLNQLYESHITTRCIPGTTLDQLILDAFDQLNKYYISELTRTKSTKSAASIGTEYLAIKASLNSELSASESGKAQRTLPTQLTPQRLAQFIGEAKCCWVLEDFHKIDPSEKSKLANVMKLFMDTAHDYPSTKIIAIGAVGTAREVVEYDPEMRNRVSEIHVPLMNKSEILGIINKGEHYLNITLSEQIKNAISDYSNGLAAVCHQLCLNICIEHGLQHTS